MPTGIEFEICVTSPAEGQTARFDGGGGVDDLLGLDWSGWVPVDRVLDGLTGSEIGLYLLRRRGADELLYVGEGKIRDRVNAHMKKGRNSDHLFSTVLEFGQHENRR
jgi:hypothetical protein